MGKTRIIIGTHNHLPLGRSEEAAERLYQESLKPFLAVLYRYPGFPVTLHYSGILMEWLEESHPELLTLLEEMVGRGQVEVLGGGYYDPDPSAYPHERQAGAAGEDDHLAAGPFRDAAARLLDRGEDLGAVPGVGAPRERDGLHVRGRRPVRDCRCGRR